jgi:hypothetical protein
VSGEQSVDNSLHIIEFSTNTFFFLRWVSLISSLSSLWVSHLHTTPLSIHSARSAHQSHQSNNSHHASRKELRQQRQGPCVASRGREKESQHGSVFLRSRVHSSQLHLPTRYTCGWFCRCEKVHRALHGSPRRSVFLYLQYLSQSSRRSTRSRNVAGQIFRHSLSARYQVPDRRLSVYSSR